MTRPHQSADARSITRKLNGCFLCPTITRHPTQGLGQSPGPFSCLISPRHAGFRPHVYVLAIRSTELLPRTYPGSDGQPVRGRDGRVMTFGDGERDMRADMGIANMGFALGQIDSVLKQLDAFAAEHPGAKFEQVGSSLSSRPKQGLSARSWSRMVTRSARVRYCCAWTRGCRPRMPGRWSPTCASAS